MLDYTLRLRGKFMNEDNNEPENLVLRLLREIRAEVAEIRTKQNEHDEQFKELRQEIEQMKTQMVFALGTATSVHIRTNELEAWRIEAERKQRDAEAWMDDIQRRLKQDPHPDV
jgi:uncharacterized coiled-coil DUF342 family protein